MANISALFASKWHDPWAANNSTVCSQCLVNTQGTSRRVLYIKTHKTGSSTLTGILWRALCDHLQVNCFVPPAQHAGRIWNLDISSDHHYMTTSPGSQGSRAPFDAWIHHLRYQPAGSKRLVREPFLLLSSVRRPALRFQSAWHWYNLGESLNTTLKEFVKSISSQSSNNKRSWRFRTGLDATSEELTGLRVSSGKHFRSAFYKELVPMIASGKIFLVVCDRFEESIVILRKLLCYKSYSNMTALWDYFPQKVNENISRSQLLEEELDRLDQAQPHDLLVYRLANYSLDRYISNYGASFLDDLRHYRIEIQNTRARCALEESEFCISLRRDNREAVLHYWQQHQSRVWP
eukprot:scaffold243_cov163-Ochromonas_danica.AAC.12